MSTKYLLIGGHWNVKPNRVIEVGSKEELQQIVRREHIQISKTMKLGTIWGRKWIDFLGRIDGEDVYLADETFGKKYMERVE